MNATTASKMWMIWLGWVCSLQVAESQNIRIEVEYGSSNREVTLLIPNKTGDRIPYSVARHNQGFMLKISDKISAGITFPPMHHFIDGGGEFNNFLQNDLVLQHTFDLTQAALPPGDYKVSAYWSGVGSSRISMADTSVEDIDLKISENGDWDFIATSKTKVKPVQMETYLSSHPGLMDKTVRIMAEREARLAQINMKNNNGDSVELINPRKSVSEAHTEKVNLSALVTPRSSIQPNEPIGLSEELWFRTTLGLILVAILIGFIIRAQRRGSA